MWSPKPDVPGEYLLGKRILCGILKPFTKNRFLYALISELIPPFGILRSNSFDDEKKPEKAPKLEYSSRNLE